MSVVTRALVLLLVAVAVACGGDDDATTTATGSTSSPDGSAATSPAGSGDGSLDAEVVALEPIDHPDEDAPGPGLLVDEVDVAAFAGRHGLGALPEAEAAVRDGSVLVGAALVTPCDPPTEVTLRVEEGDVRVVAVTRGDEVCEALASTAVLLAVDPEAIGAEGTIEGRPLDAPVGPGTVVVVASLGVAAERTGGQGPVEISSPADLDGFVARPDRDDDVVLDLDAASTGPDEDRVRLAFVVEGCQAATAELVVDDDGVRAELRQADEERGVGVECEAPEPYLVVADLPEELWA